MNSIARYGMKYNDGRYCMWSIDTQAWCGDRVMFINVYNRGSYMSDHVLLNLLNELGKKQASHFISFSQQVR